MIEYLNSFKSISVPRHYDNAQEYMSYIENGSDFSF